MNATFNPAFIDVSGWSPAAVKRLGHADDVEAPVAGMRTNRAHPMVARLRAAAAAFDAQSIAQPWKQFLVGKAATCLDMAARLEQFGDFASDKQAEFAAKLVGWSGVQAQEGAQSAPGAPIAPAPVPSPCPAPVVRLDALHSVMQNHAKFYVGGLTLARKQADQLVWVKHVDAEKVVGKIDNGVLTLWPRQGVDMGDVGSLLEELNADPLVAARKYGKLSGRCCSCGADLVDPASIERGQGPICAGKF